MRCDYCPVEPGPLCIGERAHRLCDLVNPAHPDYRAGYRTSIPMHTEDPDVVIARVEAMASQAPRRGGCCG